MVDFLSDLAASGLIHQVSESGPVGESALTDRLAHGAVTGYIGFDPTAPSLHVGSLLQVLILMRFQRAGHRPIAVVGGGTGLIGDPSGKTVERSMLSPAEIEFNLDAIRSQLERFLDFSGDNGAVVVNNADWLCRLNHVAFLRDVGKFFSVKEMIARDSVRQRLNERDHGMSFTEFSYALLQAYDFLELHDRYGCELQMGGSDQWGNIIDGIDLIRRVRRRPAWGLTAPLVVKADGKKFGKTEEGNIWLDAALTSPFAFYQFWINCDDADVMRYLRFFTFLSAERVAELQELVAAQPGRRDAQKALASEVTRLVHGSGALAAAQRVVTVLFDGGNLRDLSGTELRNVLADMPRTALPREHLGTQQADVAAVLAASGLAPSRAQARTAIQSGAIRVNGRIVATADLRLEMADVLEGGFIVLQRGKKSHHVVTIVS